MKLGSELNAIQACADAIKAGKTVSEAEAVMKSMMDKDTDADDFSNEKKAQMTKACQGLVTGGDDSQLAFKVEKSVKKGEYG